MGLRAMFSAISGLQSHSTWLDVIGNNIANVNTTAFKSSRVTFSDAMSQTTSGGSSPSTSSNLGGVNPTQVGMGSRVSSIQTLFNPGPISQTGNASDVAINGDGFFVVKEGTTSLYTRAGNLTFDGDGNLVDANGGLVQGYQAKIEYQTTTFNSESTDPWTGAAAPAGTTADITRATMVLDTTNSEAIGNIQIDSGMTLPARATSELTIKGNLDSFLQATDVESGGMFDQAPGGNPLLPVGVAMLSPWITVDPNKLSTTPNPAVAGTNFEFQQVVDLTLPGAPPLSQTEPTPVVVNGIDLASAKANATNAWELGNQYPPAHTIVQNVYDSLGNPREVTIQFYQVNDLGDGYDTTTGIGNNPSGPSQVCYAWYAFETTGGAAPSNDNLLGGTAIIEGDYGTGLGTMTGYDRNMNAPGARAIQFSGDFIYFNTDGSLASQGGVQFDAGAMTQVMAEAHIYLPAQNAATLMGGVGGPPVSPLPTVGAEVLDIALNFGTAGTLTNGGRDGLYSDAAGSYQVINGVNTYIPNHTAQCTEQDGYPEGQLAGLNFDASGILKGKFTTSAGDKVVDLAQLVIARVSNPEGLNKVGSSYYSSSNNSGNISLTLAGKDGMGTIEGYSLEGSNVDLTVELTNMIIAQRGFEVNARAVTTTNETLQTLVQLGR